MYAASNPATMFNLYQVWNETEFNVFGDCCSSQANFNSGATIVVRTAVNSGTVAAPLCTGDGFTAETNNLSFAGHPNPARRHLPAVVFTESTAGGAASPCDSATTVSGLPQTVPPSPETGAPGETVLYRFQGTDGFAPNGDLIADSEGALYGTTVAGGTGCAGSCGTVFKLTPPAAGQTQWTETVLYNFCSQTNCVDGDIPVGNLVFDSQGALYGVTNEGGASTCEYGCGTVFKLTPPGAGQTQWTESVLYSFQGAPLDAAGPQAGLIIDQLRVRLDRDHGFQSIVIINSRAS